MRSSRNVFGCSKLVVVGVEPHRLADVHEALLIDIVLAAGFVVAAVIVVLLNVERKRVCHGASVGEGGGKVVVERGRETPTMRGKLYLERRSVCHGLPEGREGDNRYGIFNSKKTYI